MSDVVARIKVKGKHYEIMVNLDAALKFRAGKGEKGDIMSALDCSAIFYDLKKGTKASGSDLTDAFGTTDFYEAAKQIILKGEIQKNQEFRDEEKEKRVKQVIDLILRVAVDQHGRPYTDERIRRAAHEVHYNFDSQPAEHQFPILLEKLKTVIPIKVETKKIELRIPARFTGQVYGVCKGIKESEEWLPNGDLQIIVNIPAGMQIDFFEKLNSITHGAVQSRELEQK